MREDIPSKILAKHKFYRIVGIYLRKNKILLVGPLTQNLEQLIMITLNKWDGNGCIF